MGGLCGFLGQNDKNLLATMNNLLSHRGRRTDYYIDDDISFATRSIENEANIVKSADNVMAFQGEIYNFEDLENQFVSRGINSNQSNEAALILQLFNHKNAKAFEELRGSFAAAIWNSSEEKLTLTRDHLGQDTLYYCRINDRIFFASEIKPLLYARKAILSVRPNINPKALTQYLQYGYVPSPNTLFNNIIRLPAASYSCYKKGNLKGPNRYWTPVFSTGVFNETDTMKKIHDTILEMTQLGMQRHKRFAVLLSGGLDSSLLASFVRKCTGNQVDSYTFTLPGQKNSSAQSIADFLDLTHHEVTMDAEDAMEALMVLPKIYADLISDPFIALPTYALVKAAEDQGTIFAADGADNIFWGLPYLYDHFTYVKRARKLPSALRRLSLCLAGKFGAIYAYQRSFEHLLTASLSEDPYMHMISIFTEREAKKLFPASPFMNPPHKLSNGNMDTITLTDFYRRQQATAPDRPSMISRIGPICSNFTLKLHEPFLDVRLVELANKIPPSLKQPSKNMDKLILRKMARKFELLPKDFHQRKMGLSCPLDYWYEKDLREWTSQLLSDELPPFLNTSYVMSLLERRSFVDRLYNRSASHRTSSRDIFTLLMLTLWFKEYSPEMDLISCNSTSSLYNRL